MQNGYRFRCYPTRGQRAALVRWIGCQRHIYNAKVKEDRYFRRFLAKSLSLTGQRVPIDQQYSQFKDVELTPWLSEAPSVVLRNGAVRWKQAYSRYFKKLGGRPKIHGKSGSQSVWLTRELFRFEPCGDIVDGKTDYRLFVGNTKFLVGEIEFVADREYRLPASIVLTVDAGHWFLSFSADDQTPEPTEEEIVAELNAMPELELTAATVGVDRGVAIPICAGPGAHYDFSDIQKRRMEKKERARKRWQRKLSRRIKASDGKKASKGVSKAKKRVADYYQYSKQVRRDFAHQTSHRLATAEATRLIVFEDLRVQNMTRKPKAKKDEQGRWQRNGARAKAGLNQKILASAWSQTKTYTRYKALRLRKLLAVVPPQYSSQECGQCGHIHPENRPEQAVFLCQRCGYQANADDNASAVLVRRGVTLIRSGKYEFPERKRIMRFRKQEVGTEHPEPSPIGRKRRRRLKQDTNTESRFAHESMKLETPTTAAQAA